MTDRHVAIVTGASRGIGRATALAFAGEGHALALVARDAAALAGVADEVRAVGGEPLVCAGDIGDLNFARAAVDRTVQAWGRIDVLVNNAAWRTRVTMRHISVEEWEQTVRVCLTAPAFLARWAAEVMERRGGGTIVNVSSMMSRQADGTSPAYVACKGALDSLTYELAALYGRAGIRVVSVNPGWIDTDISRDAQTADGAPLTTQTDAPLRDMLPLGRPGTAQEVAAAIAWLAGPQASYVTGTRLLIDGGWHHQHMPYTLKRMQFPEDFT